MIEKIIRAVKSNNKKRGRNITIKNRTKGEWIVGAGIGYKF